ncbi:hypothetical protein SADUNF_Sadunf08G0053400 [Salix dunnii]|uniref:Uncharacterized protein n=1 Tax=Salix dunnii TaxID=1413687 RepID=A0A835K0X7_9ROSI|nr:hypothetical protein SADUNF_Sadunf08G0053400 [Salix dunnii]
MPLGPRPLDGEHDCRLGRPLVGSTEEDRELGAPGLPLVAESGRSDTEVLKFGGASSEKPGISEGFHGLDFTVGEEPRDGTGFLAAVGADLVTAGADLVSVGADKLTDLVTVGADKLGELYGVDSRRVGVAALDVNLDGGIEGLAVGVEDRVVDLVSVADRVVDLDGVEDLAGTVEFVEEVVDLAAETVGLAAETVGLDEDSVAREVGVDDLEGLEPVVTVGHPVGVEGLDPGPPDDEGLRIAAPEEFNPGEEADCLDTKLPLPLGSGWGLASYDHNEQNSLSILIVNSNIKTIVSRKKI